MVTTRAMAVKEATQQEQDDLPMYVGLGKGAVLVDVSVPTLRRWLTQGRLKRYKIGGHTLLKTSELLGLVKEAD